MLLIRKPVMALVLTLALLVSAAAQTPVRTGGPSQLTRDVRSVLVQPGVPSTLMPFTVDPASGGGDRFHIISTNANAVVTLILPSGTEVTSGNAQSLGFSYEVAPADASEPDSSIPTPLLNPGTQTLIGLPATSQAGTYQVKVNTLSASGVSLILANYYSSSLVSVGLTTDKDNYKTGDTIVLSALIFNDVTPITNATVQTEVRDSAIPPTFSQQIQLIDSGQYDAATGDGIYTGSLVLNTSGSYIVSIRVTGTSSGVNFSRFASTSFRVLPSAATFTSVSAAGVDDNGNGRVDRVEITANLNVPAAGKYMFGISLWGDNNQFVRATTEANLTAGSQQQLKVSFPAIDFVDPKTGRLKLGRSGGFDMKHADLHYVNAPDFFKADSLENAGTTGTYLFERNSIIFTGNNSISTTDPNGNGKYDSLRVTAEVNLLDAGNYIWQARLVDPTGAEVANYNVITTLPPSSQSVNISTAGTYSLVFNFDGQLISRSGKNGPYTVETAVVYSTDVAANATAVNNLITSAAYLYTQFEPPIILECRNFQSALPSGQSTVTVTYPLPNALGAIYPVTTSCTPPPGSGFLTGVTTINCTTTESISNLTTSCSGTLTVTSTADTIPPTISCPANVQAVIPYRQGSGPVTYPNPVVSDNRTGATFSCTPASGSNFFRGVTPVTCTASDTSNNQASCSFTVSVYDVSLQDNQLKHTLWFNSTTGDYYFFSCDGGGYTLAGKGTITRQGCEVRLGGDPRVSATFVACASTPSVRYGNALIKPNPVGGWFYITDSNSLDNLNRCPSH